VSVEMIMAIQRWEDEGGRSGDPIICANSIDKAGHQGDRGCPQHRASELSRMMMADESFPHERNATK
jgi:hypothetical protein